MTTIIATAQRAFSCRLFAATAFALSVLAMSAQAVPQADRRAGDAAGHRALFGFCRAAGRRGASRVLAAVSALDRRRGEAAMDLVAARHRDRRLRSGRLGFPGRHAAVEGVFLRRPARRDALHGAPADGVALCRLCVERGRRETQLVSAEGPAWRLPARRWPVAHDPRRQRLQGVPPGRPQRGAGVQRASALAAARSGRAACRDRPASTSTTLIERGLLVGLPASARVAPRSRSIGDRTRGARLPARQLRALSQRARPVAQCRAVPASERRSPGRRAIASTVDHPVGKPAPGQSPDATLRIEPRHPDRSALLQRIASRYPGAADAAARHRAGRRRGRRSARAAGSRKRTRADIPPGTSH